MKNAQSFTFYNLPSHLIIVLILNTHSFVALKTIAIIIIIIINQSIIIIIIIYYYSHLIIFLILDTNSFVAFKNYSSYEGFGFCTQVFSSLPLDGSEVRVSCAPSYT
jgi:hypothetical protein